MGFGALHSPHTRPGNHARDRALLAALACQTAEDTALRPSFEGSSDMGFLD